MHSQFVPLFCLLAAVVVFLLAITGWGQALLLWPFGVRPLFPANASLTEIYGMDPRSCDIDKFQERHDELKALAEKSRLATLNQSRLNAYYREAAPLMFPRLLALNAENRTRLLEAYSDLQSKTADLQESLDAQGLREHFPHLRKPVHINWRQVLWVRSQTPTRNELEAAFVRALSDVQGSAKAIAQVETAMSQARAELNFAS